ncbi:MAG TPA: thiamine phosphate synthase [Gaiellaceae bacterium]|nr:thiamine phosphate synthase [Gaiellaceae bacterium]
MRLHAIVDNAETGRAAVDGGATVVQLRRKGASTAELVEAGRGFPLFAATFIVNDDVEAALQLGADGVHLGRDDEGAERAVAEGLILGRSASSADEARAGEQLRAAYIGAGPVWATPSKADADPPIGLEGLADICRAVAVPVVAIGGVDASNAAECIRAGAAGVAVIRAARDARALRAAIDAAL